MEDYQYVPLDPRAPNLRLLRLHKGDTIAIKCQIFHALISDPNTTSYEALSYVWGSTELVEHIEVEGRRLGITDNLYAALQNLRLPEQDRILWVDAVCIDQSNTAERSQQVMKMGRIFGSASRVIFWLGKPTVEVTLLMKTLAQLEVEYATWCQRSALAVSTPMMMLMSAVQSLDYDLQARLRIGLQVLFARPWFERVWILQEVRNARFAVVCCGPFSVSAEIFGLGPSLLAQSVKMHIQHVLEMMIDHVGLDQRCQQAQYNSLIDLLTKFHAYKATDQRDMIFALLGISSEPLDHKLLCPDYTKSLLHVVRDVIDYWFRWTTTSVERILGFVHDFRDMRATYLVLRVEEKPGVSSLRDPFSYNRDESLLFLGTDQEEFTGELDGFHRELDELHSRAKTDIEGRDEPIRITPSPHDSSSAKFLIVEDLRGGLKLLVRYGYRHLFDFVAARSVKDRPELYGFTMYQAAVVGSCDILELLLGKGVNINWTPHMEGDALYVASEHGHVDIVQMLLDNGADVNAVQEYYPGALTIASEQGHEDVVRILIDRGANVNPGAGHAGSPLHRAIVCGHEEVVRMLLDEGADVSAPSYYHDSALQAALVKGSEKVVQMLLDKGADVNAPGNLARNGSALYMASKHGHEKLVQMLLDNGANINAQETRQNGSALNAALNAGHENIVQMLLDNGVDVNMPGGPYYNALQLASAKGNEKMLQMLLKAGADVNAPGLGYGSALTLASEYRHKEIVKMLLEHGAKEGSEDREQSHISHG